MYFKLEIYDDSEFKKLLYKQDGVISSWNWSRPVISDWTNSWEKSTFLIEFSGAVENTICFQALREYPILNNDISDTRFSKILGNK